MKLYQAREIFVFTTIAKIKGQYHVRINNQVLIYSIGEDITMFISSLNLIKDLTRK